MNEIQAAFGLLELKYVDEAIAQRRAIDARYRDLLSGVVGITCLEEPPDTVGNFAYFPIFVDADYPISRDALDQRLRDSGIYARRYFYPLISEFPMYRGLPSANLDNLPVALKASQEVLCLPIYPTLEMSVVEEVSQLIASPQG